MIIFLWDLDESDELELDELDELDELELDDSVSESEELSLESQSF